MNRTGRPKLVRNHRVIDIFRNYILVIEISSNVTLNTNRTEKETDLRIISRHLCEFEFNGVLRHMQRYFGHICDGIDVQAD